jgi:preprotein translocase SecF subunit
MDLIRKTNIDFVTKRSTIFTMSIVLTLVVLLASLVLGVDRGIDFTGGTQVTVRYQKKTATTETVRAHLGEIGLSNAELKSFGADGEYLIRVQSSGNASQVSANIVRHLQEKSSNDTVELLGADNVESKVSSELAIDSIIAIVVSFIAILLYVAFRFEFVYGLGSIVALVYDLLMAFGVSVLFNKTGLLNLELNINSIAAYLTILGYSINDKVVVFDRIRENRERHKGMSLVELVNLSLNETLSRTLITGISVIAALLVLVFFGGDVLEGFAFTMLIGIVIGTYSSIYIAASFVIWYTDRVKHKNVGVVQSAKT